MYTHLYVYMIHVPYVHAKYIKAERFICSFIKGILMVARAQNYNAYLATTTIEKS